VPTGIVMLSERIWTNINDDAIQRIGDAQTRIGVALTAK